jgi:alanine-glyoxylate transaminase/serine-glyoxylate transaminase/serine-pyruvate transaminase
VLAAHPDPKLIAVVHAETSTGVRSDIAELGAGKGDALLLADCVTSLGGIDVRIDDWGVDIAYSGTQKCLGVPPGLAPLTVSPRALEQLRPVPQSWYLDLNMIAKYVAAAHARHAAVGQLLQDGLQERGFELFAAEGYRLPQLTSVRVPENVDEAAVRGRLLADYNIEIGGGLGELAGKGWRIGLMGHTARPRNVGAFLSALDAILAS